jgi:hypothetical protein
VYNWKLIKSKESYPECLDERKYPPACNIKCAVVCGAFANSTLPK